MATLTKRQKQLLDYLNNYIGQFGYAPTLQEIGGFFGLSSLATIHKHLKNLEAKGFIKRKWNHSRALEMVDSSARGAARELPLLGRGRGRHPDRIYGEQRLDYGPRRVHPAPEYLLSAGARRIDD